MGTTPSTNMGPLRTQEKDGIYILAGWAGAKATKGSKQSIVILFVLVLASIWCFKLLQELTGFRVHRIQSHDLAKLFRRFPFLSHVQQECAKIKARGCIVRLNFQRLVVLF